MDIQQKVNDYQRKSSKIFAGISGFLDDLKGIKPEITVKHEIPKDSKNNMILIGIAIVVVIFIFKK